MANIRIYNVENVTTSHKNVMFNIYQDFFNKSEADYAFESEPVDFYKFFEFLKDFLNIYSKKSEYIFKKIVKNLYIKEKIC